MWLADLRYYCCDCFLLNKGSPSILVPGGFVEPCIQKIQHLEREGLSEAARRAWKVLHCCPKSAGRKQHLYKHVTKPELRAVRADFWNDTTETESRGQPCLQELKQTILCNVTELRGVCSTSQARPYPLSGLDKAEPSQARRLAVSQPPLMRTHLHLSSATRTGMICLEQPTSCVRYK